MSTITVETANRRFPTAKNLYGIFFEDINRAGDGGLYPEMLRNRSFEDSIPPVECETEENDYAVITPAGWRDEFNHGEGLSRWIRENKTEYTPIPAWYCENADMELDRKDTLNKNRSGALSVTFRPGGYIYNTGFAGVPQKEGEVYRFYMFAKAKEPLNLSLFAEEDGERWGETEIRIEGTDYRRYELEFRGAKTTGKARFTIMCREGGELRIGFTSLMPGDTFRGHGLRKDLAEKLENMHPTFLRFPGGCIVEGFTPSTAMRFRNTIGPVWERPGHLLMWHYHTTNGLGYHEYLQFCEDLQMEPLYVFNCGMTCQARNSVLMEGEEREDMIQDTLDAIEYAVASPESEWGKVRGAAGHPEPFRMNYVEIGNENSGPDYEERYLECYTRIKEKYPWIQFIANSHLEEKGLPVDIVDEHYYNSVEFFAENIRFYDNYDRNGPKIFVGELAVLRGPVGRLYAAMGEAMFLIGMERNQDIVALASYAPLLENYHYYAWYPNLLIFDNLYSYCIPTYYAWKLLGESRGDYVVASLDETEYLYRPVKGMPSLLGAAGMRYRNAVWNGSPVRAVHEVMGHEMSSGDEYIITEPDEEQRVESIKMGANPNEVLVVLGEDEEAAEGTFEVEIFAEEGREIGIGIYSSRIPREVYMNDETHPPREWNAGIVRPFRWKIKDGRSSLTEKSYPKPIALTGEVSVELTAGAFHKFKYTADGREINLFIDGKFIQKAEIPKFPAMASVVCDTEEEILLKLVNIASEPDDITVKLDCEVENVYEVSLLTGEKQDENTIERPQKVQDTRVKLEGASSRFCYRAPAYSLNVLRLRKK